MIDTILGRKIGMTQVWNEEDELVPVTVIEAGPCVISQVKSVETDGYNAVQIGYGEMKKSRVNQPMQGHFDKNGLEPVRTLKEVRIKKDDETEYNVGDEITIENFADAEKVHVTGITKGKGFQGVVRRHKFATGPSGHGSHFHRSGGSVGMATKPGRVLKNTRMPGQMGNDRVTVRNLDVVRVDPDNNLILIKGSVPGGKNGLVSIRMA